MKSLLAAFKGSNKQSSNQSNNQTNKPVIIHTSSTSSSPQSVNRSVNQSVNRASPQPPPLPKSRPSLSSVNQSTHQHQLCGSDSVEGVPNFPISQPNNQSNHQLTSHYSGSMKRATGPCDYQSNNQSINPFPSLPSHRSSLTSTPSKKAKNDSTFTLPHLSINQTNNQAINQTIKPRFAALNMQDAGFEEGEDCSIIISINQNNNQSNNQTNNQTNNQSNSPTTTDIQIQVPTVEGSSISLNINPFNQTTNQSFNQSTNLSINQSVNQSRLSLAGFDDDNESCIEISMHCSMDETKEDQSINQSVNQTINQRPPRISPRKHLIPQRHSINQTIKQSNNQSISQSNNQTYSSDDQPMVVTTVTTTTTTTTYIVPPSQPFIPALCSNTLQSINQSINLLINDNQSNNQPISQSTNEYQFVPSKATNTASTTTTITRAAKLDYFLHDCTQITEHLFIGGAIVAQDRNILNQKGITHVVNACGAVCDNFFEETLLNENPGSPEAMKPISYHRLWLQDRGSEDIICILYDVIDFCEKARKSGGKVLIHCQQGVSRSTVLAIGYLMLTQDKDYDDVYEKVREKRGITRPNFGFMCQLLAWRKRIRGKTIRSFGLYRFAAHSQHDRSRIVNKWADSIEHSIFDSRFILLLHSPHALYIWQGEQVANDADREARHLLEVRKTCRNLQKHEFAPSRIIHIIRHSDGQETVIDRSLEFGLSSTEMDDVMRERARIRATVAMEEEDDDDMTPGAEGEGDSDEGDTDRKRERDHADAIFNVDQPAEYFYQVMGGRPVLQVINQSINDEYLYEVTAPCETDRVARMSLFEGPPRASLLNFASPTRGSTPRSLTKKHSNSRRPSHNHSHHLSNNQSSHQSHSPLPPIPQLTNETIDTINPSFNRPTSIKALQPLEGETHNHQSIKEVESHTFVRPAFLRGLSVSLPTSPLPHDEDSNGSSTPMIMVMNPGEA